MDLDEVVHRQCVWISDHPFKSDNGIDVSQVIFQFGIAPELLCVVFPPIF